MTGKIIAVLVAAVGVVVFVLTCAHVMQTIGPNTVMPRWCTASLMLSAWAVIVGVTVSARGDE